MPDPKPKTVMVNGLGVVQFPATMDDTKIAAAIKAHKDQIVSPNEAIPPEVERIERAVGVRYKLGKPIEGSDSIASVGEHEPHIIEINDKVKWNKSPAQVKAHELIHLAMNQMAGKVKEAIPPDSSDPKKKYDISGVDQLRAKGLKLWQLPQEMASTIVQTYVADPSQRARLGPWIQDLNNAPLSVMEPTGPNDKTINRAVRPPIPPIEAYLTPEQMKERAIRLNPVNTLSSNAGMELVKRSEGFRPNVYKDSSGHATIGYGHRIGPNESFPNGVTHEQALAMLYTDVGIADRNVRRLVKVSLTKGQHDALVDFTFNFGPERLANSTLLKNLNAGDYDAAGKQLLLWNHAGGKVSKGLTTRRNAEYAMWNGASALPNPQDVKNKAKILQAQFNKTNTLPPQPKEALNQYPNPEDRPPNESFAFNKGWAKPGPYATKLSPQEEQEFRKWAAANPGSVRGEVGPAPNFDPLPLADYDVRGHFHAAKTGDPAATLVPNKWDGKIHGNDKFKTPYNGGFSNESMYALPNAPRWIGNKLMTFDGKLVTDETPRKQ